MKFISGLFKFIAVILMVVLVLVLPLTLVFQGAGSLLLSPGKLVQLLEDNLIDADVIARVAQYQFDQLKTGRDENLEAGDNPFARILMDGLGNLDHDEWVEITTLLVPTDLIDETIEDILSAYYRWVNGANETPRISLDLEPWKSNFKTNLIPAIEMIMGTLPECSPEEQQVFLSGGELSADAPSCRPGEPVYGLFIEQASTTVPALIDDMPDDYNLGKQLEENEEVDWQKIKETLAGLAFVTQASWIAALIIFVVAIPLGARSFSGVFHWAGWPILFAGILTLLLSLVMILFSQGALTDLKPVNEVVDASPEFLSKATGQVFADGIRFIARPLLIEGAAMIFLGGVGIIIGISIAARVRKQEQMASDQILPQSAAEAVPPQGPQVVAEVVPEETIEFREEELDQGSEDEDRPSGMFG